MEQVSQNALQVVIVGHVDHGKSTLVGRLLHDTNSLPSGKLEQIQESCRLRGVPLEWAYLLDALKAERDQNVTIDISQVAFRTPNGRVCTIIDAPGHKEFLKNMVTGAARADAALLLVSAPEGVQEQTRRHGKLLSVLGIKEVVVVVNKMDAVEYRHEVFTKIETEYRKFLEGIGIEPRTFIPVSARDGENILKKTEPRLAWYDGPTVVDLFDSLRQPTASDHLPLRFPVQDVYRFDNRRIIVGRIESGTLKEGDELEFAPHRRSSVVKKIEVWPEDSPTYGQSGERIARAGMSVGITLMDPIFVERGSVASHLQDLPIKTNRFHARIFWLGEKPLDVGAQCIVKIATQEMRCQVVQVVSALDSATLDEKESETRSVVRSVQRNEVAEVIFQSRLPIVLDNYEMLPNTGRFVIANDEGICGGGVVEKCIYTPAGEVKSHNITWTEGKVTHHDRTRRNGHRGAVVWFTGLSGTGKSTLSQALEAELFSKNFHTYILDGDNVRHGLNANLGFSHDDRAENIRRVAEVASLMADAGLVVCTAFISPYLEDRWRAREIVLKGGHTFIEVFVDTPLAVCESRDPKHLYQKARAGEIHQFTGIDAPYETPLDPELIVKTENRSIASCIDQLLEYLVPVLEN